MELTPRNTQTRVKHEILSSYLDAWGGIIVGGLQGFQKAYPSRLPGNWHFIYVDCFSYVGKYLGEKEDAFQDKETKLVYGSPIIGINALDRLKIHAQSRMGIKIRVNTILVEQNTNYYDELKRTLCEKGYATRVRETYDFYDLSDGQIAVVHADSTKIVDKLLSYTTQPDTWAFYLIDPYGPTGIPYEFVKKVVSRDHHDVMINFIFEDLLRKGGLALKDNIKPEHKQLVDNWTRAFGNDSWIRIAREFLLAEKESNTLKIALGEYATDFELNGEYLSDIKEQKFVEAYLDVLSSMDPLVARKLVNLRFGDKERTMFYLFLTTHDATGALQLNRILSDAKYLEHELRCRLQFAKKIAPPPGQLALFSSSIDDVKIPELTPNARPTIEEIANVIKNSFIGQQVTRKDVYQGLANSLYFPDEVDKAIRYLRREKLVEFSGDLKHKTVLTFQKK